MPVKASSRDGSTTDIVAFWVTKLMAEHKRGARFDNEAAIYFALISHSAHSLCALHRQRNFDTDYYESLSVLLEDLRVKLYQFSPRKLRNELNDAGCGGATYEEFEQPMDHPAWQTAWQVERYWASNRWREDFFDTFTREFWDFKDYAHGAGERKTDFLWNLAEVWVAAATSAMVHYAPDNPQRWFEVASMVRHFADQIEEDGLRSLPWGTWGRKVKGKK